MADLTPETKEKLKQAYARFESSLRAIAHEHRTTVSKLLGEIDASVASNIRERIENE
jgi:hypothetical protein